MSKIDAIGAHEVLDSRGNPTLEVGVKLKNNIFASAIVPSGASTGQFEAVELRDNDKKRYQGKGVHKAMDNVVNKIFPMLAGQDVFNQRFIDQQMIDLDGTYNKSRLGANAILGVSLAIAKAAAKTSGLSLYRYLGGPNAYVLPVPMMNVLNGGSHADSDVDIQEFMILPVGATSFKEALEWGVKVYHSLRSVLHKRNLSTGLGDEGGFAPNLKSNSEALNLIVEAIEKSGFTPGKEFFLGMDIAASEFFENGSYNFENKIQTREFMIDYYENLINKFPLITIEDPLSENDWEGWQKLYSRIGKKIQLVGDDLFVTNSQRIAKGIKYNCANSLLCKMNQIGSLSETIDATTIAKNAGYSVVVSHRSGETEDVTISDFAVAINAGQIKTGAPARSERVAKYNQLLRIEEELGDASLFAGINAFSHIKNQ